MAAGDRETRIAHLEIHGWAPVVNTATGRYGIYSEMLGIGFSVRMDTPCPMGDTAVKRWRRDHMEQSYALCNWDDVSDWHLDAIDKRLGEV